MRFIYKKRKEQIIYLLQGQENELLQKYKTITQFQLCVPRMAKDRMLGAVMNMNKRYKYSRETKKTADRSKKTQPTITRK
jgi:hypothetical protein